jgi:aspartate aminotransferase-like enzyme
MNRRTFLCGLTLETLAAPLTTGAQQTGKVWRIGFLGSTSPKSHGTFVAAFREGLRSAAMSTG